MTVQAAHAAIGRWASKTGDRPVIIIRVRGTAVLCRDGHDRGHKGYPSAYGWYAVGDLTRREDWDAQRLPNWLQDPIDKYRATGKVTADLRDAVMAHVNPAYTEAALTPADVAAEMVYRSYVAQRRLSPEVVPERWARIFDGVEAMEERYLEEVSLDNDFNASQAELAGKSRAS